MLGLVGCGAVPHRLYVGSRGLWHRVPQTSCWVSRSVAPCHTSFMLGLVGCGTVPHKPHVGSRGLQHRATSESFSTISCGFGLVSLILGSVSSPKFLKLLFLADLVHPGSTLRSREGFWEIETWVIKPRPSVCLHSSKRASCCDDATKSKFGFKRTLKERLPKPSLACRGVKQFNPIIPSADVRNLQTKNEWLKVTTHLK